MIGVITPDADGRIDFATAVRAIEAARDPAPPRTTEYQAARTLREKYTAMLRQLEYERVSGELIPAGEIVTASRQLVAAFRAKCLALPSKLAPQLATMNESREIHQALTAAVREALEELSRFSLPRRRSRGNGSAKRVIEPGAPRRPRTTPVH